MTNLECGWTEEEHIDFVLGKLPDPKREQLAQHLQTCHTCQNEVLMWQQTFGHIDESPEPSSEMHQHPNTLPMPSDDVRRRLLARALLNKLKILIRRPIISVPIATCLAIFLIISTIDPSESITPVSQPKWAQDMTHIEGISLISDPSTDAYRIEQLAQFNVDGFVWIKGKSNEMLLLINGINPSREHDYQVWAVNKNKRSNIGLLKYNRSKAYLYVNSKVLQGVDHIAVSVEPKGGSSTPTTPDTVQVNIHK
jgi:anti-sigma-K factor RskA